METERAVAEYEEHASALRKGEQESERERGRQWQQRWAQLSTRERLRLEADVRIQAEPVRLFTFCATPWLHPPNTPTSWLQQLQGPRLKFHCLRDNNPCWMTSEWSFSHPRSFLMLLTYEKDKPFKRIAFCISSQKRSYSCLHELNWVIHSVLRSIVCRLSAQLHFWKLFPWGSAALFSETSQFLSQRCENEELIVRPF